MAWCPNCGGGYRDDLEYCGWCGARLIPGEMPASEDNTVEMMILCRLRTNAQIALVTSILKGADIPFLAQDRGGGQYLRIVMGFNTFGQDIYVEASRWQEAKGMLNAYFRANPSVKIFEDDEEALNAARERDLFDEDEYDDEDAEPEEESVREGEAPEQETHWRGLPYFLLAFLVLLVLLALTRFAG